MIKIEKLLDGAKATFLREGRRQPIFLFQLISHSELATLEVESGKVVYSVDELELCEKTATETKSPESAPAPSESQPAPTAKKLTAKEIAAQAKIAAKQAAQQQQQ